MNADSSAATAILFPGQGSSVAGATALVGELCPELWELSCGLLGRDPFEHASESTRYAQPAIFLASLARWRNMAETVRPIAFAGHSLGEISALTAAGVFDPEDALRLVTLRAALMADATRGGAQGGMLALLKGAEGDAEEIASACGVVVANDNAPGQAVLSGPRVQLATAAGLARERGLRAIALDVSGAFHSPRLECVRTPFARAVRSLARSRPSAPVFSGLSAAPFVDVSEQLAAALSSPVRWRETMLALHALGASAYIDVGPDCVLARLAERNVPGCTVIAPEDVLVDA